jgi:hypothetical protein
VDQHLQTMLHIAAYEGHIHIVDWILSLPNYDINARDKNGKIILFFKQLNLNRMDSFTCCFKWISY